MDEGPIVGKNYVRILGGIAPALQRAISFSKVRVIQLRAEFACIAEEAGEAISCKTLLSWA